MVCELYVPIAAMEILCKHEGRPVRGGLMVVVQCYWQVVAERYSCPAALTQA